MGLTCDHEIQSFLTENRSLTLQEVHPHWHFLPRAIEEAQSLALEPAIAVRAASSCGARKTWSSPKQSSYGSTGYFNEEIIFSLRIDQHYTYIGTPQNQKSAQPGLGKVAFLCILCSLSIVLHSRLRKDQK